MASNPISGLPARKSFAQVAAEAHTSKTIKKSIIPVVPNISSLALATAARGNIHQVASETQVGNLLPAGKAATLEQLDGLLKAVVIQDQPIQTSSDTSFRKENSDTKSIASRTTLTLDEKESVQPDDSASMQAAPEEDTFSASGSGLAMSSRESDPDVRAFREQLDEIDQTGLAGPVTQGVTPSAGILLASITRTDPGFSMPLVVSNVPNMHLSMAPVSSQQLRAPLPGMIIPPDEKLLEALASPKDRLFVLKIEQDMIDFVKDSKEEFLQLPQTNAFYRMLSHKLADYYLLGHLVDESLTSVRIHRTPHCRLPPPLIGSDTNAVGVTPPAIVAARSIMRRGVGDASGRGQNRRNTLTPNGQNSENASGSDDDVGLSDKDKAALTREERENRYNEARARIFKDFKDQSDENIESSEQKENDVSRSSSASGAKKGKKTRRPKDDGFEARSAYSQYGGLPYSTAGYPPMVNGPGMDATSGYSLPGQYLMGAPGYDPNFAVNYAGQQYMQSPMVNQQVAWPAQPYQAAQNMSSSDAYSRGFPGVVSPQYQSWAAVNMQSQATPRPSNPQLATYDNNHQPQGDGGWHQPGYNSGTPGMSYNDNMAQQAMQSQGQQMYSYPAAAYNGYPYSDAQYYDGQANSFDQQMFNPQSQSFVPRPRVNPYQQMQHEAGANVHASTAVYPGFMPAQRQNSNTTHLSQMSGYNSPHFPQPVFVPAPTRPLGQGSNTSGPQASRQHQTSQSSIAKWGTPSTLPAKPPPSVASQPLFQAQKDAQAQSLPQHSLPGFGRSPASGTR